VKRGQKLTWHGDMGGLKNGFWMAPKPKNSNLYKILEIEKRKILLTLAHPSLSTR